MMMMMMMKYVILQDCNKYLLALSIIRKMTVSIKTFLGRNSIKRIYIGEFVKRLLYELMRNDASFYEIPKDKKIYIRK